MADSSRLRALVKHDPCLVSDRSPVGAVTAGANVRVRLRLEGEAWDQVREVEVLVGERSRVDDGISWRTVPLSAVSGGFGGEIAPAPAPHVAFYAFALHTPHGDYYYVPSVDGRTTCGELVAAGIDGHWGEGGWLFDGERLAERPLGDFGLAYPSPGFQVTVYDPGFSTPDWLAGAVMYQIFPDRFAHAARGVLHEGLRYHRDMNRPVILHEDWNEPVRWTGEAKLEPHAGEGGPTHGADAGATHPEAFEGALPDGDGDLGHGEHDAGDAEGDGSASRGEGDALQIEGPPSELLVAAMRAYDPVDFFGGSLDGIREKLPYLASLGVEVLYLNPLFEARSNHRYDTADYERVDPLLGTEAAFRRLAREASHLGISIVLDAVLSHTGDDSRYFNAKGSYDQPGAAQGHASPFFAWYDFESDEPGAPYRCWWGDPTLPEVNERDASWQRYILGTYDDGQGEREGVLAKWLHAGARGYRLDVADEIPDDVLARIRACAKEANPEAAIIGEVWEDATTKASYGVNRDYALGASLDSVMNYPLREALIGFALGRVDAHQLATFLRFQQANYPQPIYRCLMNLLSSHDVERMRSVLSLGRSVKHVPRNEQLGLTGGITRMQDERGARLQRMIAGLLYAVPGVPCLYYGDERGLQGGGDPFCRSTFPWDDGPRADRGADLTGYYQRIGMLRKTTAALRKGEMACRSLGPDVIGVIRFLSDAGRRQIALAVANRSGEARRVAFDLKGIVPFAEQVDAFEDGIVAVDAPACSTAFFIW